MRTGIVLGMHPDQATEAIIDFAIRFGRSFAVVPCCVFARPPTPSTGALHHTPGSILHRRASSRIAEGALTVPLPW